VTSALVIRHRRVDEDGALGVAHGL
jgi:hypothetical protein